MSFWGVTNKKVLQILKKHLRYINELCNTDNIAVNMCNLEDECVKESVQSILELSENDSLFIDSYLDNCPSIEEVFLQLFDI